MCLSSGLLKTNFNTLIKNKQTIRLTNNYKKNTQIQTIAWCSI